MFEKEAEEYEDNAECIEIDDYGHKVYGWYEIEQAYQKGAEFAYNKANEWHYPSKGEYPEENLECLCIDKVWTGQTFTTILKCCDGVFIDSNETPYDVIAWKEIVLPELKESE